LNDQDEIFTREPGNPILKPGDAWWEARGVLNPGAAAVNGRIALVYRAVGNDGLSRLGVTWSDDGRVFSERRFFHEAMPDDAAARLGIEDPRLTYLEDHLWMTYTKTSVAPVGAPELDWEPAPFRVRMALARADDLTHVSEERPLLSGVQSKDGVLFPRRIAGYYHALVRVYPSIQVTRSSDLKTWSPPQTVLEPIPGTWESERIGAGPPPLETPWGWLLIYHANAFYEASGNKRHYRTGLALLDLEDPSKVLYRRPNPIFSPHAEYEKSGPVGMVVFATGLIERAGDFYLYYGAADGVIGLAVAPVQAVYDILRAGLGGFGHDRS
jgi:predicted GH43/DUF377 family glycosyl hydrolase